MALTAMLMVGVMAVVADLAAAGVRQAAGQRTSADGTEELVRLVREDLDHADAFDAPGPDELVLTGMAALGGQDRRRTHRPVRVRYELAAAGGRSWLVRRQEDLDVLADGKVFGDLVCSGVTRFALVAADGDGPAVVWRLRVWMGDERPVVDRVVAIRREEQR